MSDPRFSCYHVAPLPEDEFLYACRTLNAVVMGQLVIRSTSLPYLPLQVDGHETRLKFTNHLIHSGMIALRDEMSMWNDWDFISFCTRWHAINDALDNQELKDAGLVLEGRSKQMNMGDAVYRVAAKVQLDGDGKLPIPDLIQQCRNLLANSPPPIT